MLHRTKGQVGGGSKHGTGHMRKATVRIGLALGRKPVTSMNAKDAEQPLSNFRLKPGKHVGKIRAGYPKHKGRGQRSR